MAAKQFKIKVVSNPEFCGIDAGGVQFAHGEATIEEGVMVGWFQEHKGYSVEELGSGEKTIEKMKLEELKAYAAEKGIDIGGAVKRDEIIDKIKAAEGNA